MARNKITPEEIIENITLSTLEEVMHNSMMPYAEHVILERALPRAEDGLKPVQRRILYTMHELALSPDKPHRKCARIVGDCLGKYHPHGDSSVYDALSRMAQDFSMRYPLVNGHGNFGSIDGDSPAAMRYTEARMEKLTLEMLRDIEKNTIPFVLNFEDELQEPDLLPSRYPNLLVNGSSGIAVGLATNIPPHNLGETIDATVAMLKNPSITVEELMTHIQAPDFPTGGIIIKNDELYQAYSKGKGKIKIRAKVDIEPSVSGRHKIVISEIPYQISKASMLEKIQKLTEDKEILYGKIYGIRDESDRTGMRAVIETKKDVDVAQVLNILYKYSDLEVTYGINLVAIANGKPKALSLKELLYYYIEHQKTVVLNRTKYDLEKSKIKAHILEGLLIALNNIDEVIKIIRSSKTPKIANANLCTAFNLSETQAQAILDMRLQRLTNLEAISLQSDFEKLVKLIKKLEGIVKSESKLIQLIIDELEDIKKDNNDARRSEIVCQEHIEPVEIVKEEVILPYVVTYTADKKIQKYLKKDFNYKIDVSSLDLSEVILHTCPLNSNEKLMIFTNLGNVYLLPSAQIPSISKKSDRGLMLNALLESFEPNENLLFIQPLNKSMEAFNLAFVTQKGMIKTSIGSEYMINRSKYASIKLKESDSVVAIFPYDNTKDDDVILATRHGLAICFALSSVRPTARVTAGVGGIQLADGDSVIYGGVKEKGANLGILSNRGYGKATPSNDFEHQNRNGKGYKIFNLLKNQSNGSEVVAYVPFAANVPLIITQTKSKSTVLNTSELPIQSKSGKGMPLVVSILDDVVNSVVVVNKNDIQ